MLETASAKIAKSPAAAARIRLVAADTKNFALQQMFSLVIIPARAFRGSDTAIRSLPIACAAA